MNAAIIPSSTNINFPKKFPDFIKQVFKYHVLDDRLRNIKKKAVITITTLKMIADSGCDLPLNYFSKNNIELIPLKVILDGQEYDDLLDIDAETVFTAMKNGKVAKTSQGSAEKFREVFTKLAEQKQPGLYIAFSSELSGTYQTAYMIREQVLEEYPDFDLTIIDSKAASLGYGLIVHHAVQLLKSGAAKEKIIEEVKFYSQHMEHLFTVDDLEYLRRGGRVSKAGAFVGSLLNIKPLLNVENGKLIPIEKIRGRKKVLNRMLDLMEERVPI